MRVSLKWLRAYVDIDLPVDDLAEKLTMAGAEVSSVTRVGGSWDSVFVGQLVGVEPHPNADRLRLATVDLGDERQTVVCGAPNLRVSDKIAFAKVGAKLIDPHSGLLSELRPAKIRGVSSAGMVCSEAELGISESHEGIMVLSPDALLGAPLAEILGDAIMDAEVTPNRPDWLSMLGIAREVAALTGKQVRLPTVSYEEPGPEVQTLATVEIADPDLCPRYCATIVEGVTIAPSPAWMQERLVAAGMRPISNLVDITNYVMLEYGQPLHAFDYQMVADRRIIVRRARAGETMTTLDSVERELSPDVLLITDGMGPVAVAGVMGGYESEVTDATTTILLEAANFNGANIRRTEANLRLRSEASLRFEKGLNPELAAHAARRATQLMVELGGGRAARGMIDVYPGRIEPAPVGLSTERLRRVLGVGFSAERVKGVLDSLGFDVRPDADVESMDVYSPWWRTDIHVADDLVEEVARIIGYDEIPTTTLSDELPRWQPDPLRDLRQRLSDLLAEAGMQEIITYSLTGRERLEKLGPAIQPLRVANPMSAEQEYLRTTLRPGLLTTLAANERHEESGLRLFETGRIYLPGKDNLPEEREVVAGVMAGPRSERSWLGDGGAIDFFDAKGMVEAVFARLGVEVSYEAASDPALHPGRTSSLKIRHETIGLLGEVRPDVARDFGVSSRPVLVFELDLPALLPHVSRQRPYRPATRFPGVSQDIALVLDQDVPAARVERIIAGARLVRQVTLFDVYTGPQVPPGKKSLAFSVLYQSDERTLTDEEVGRAQRAIVARLERELDARLRG